MTLQFPASPSLNETFTASNNIIYKWDGEKWITLGSSAVDTSNFVRNDIDNTYAGLISSTGTEAFGVPVGTTAEQPANADGLLRYNSTLDRYEGSSNGSWGALGGGATGVGGFKNQLINGDFRIMQRADGSNNVVTAPSGTNYTFDRWITNSNSTTSKRIDGNGIPIAQVLSSGPIHLVQGIELNTVLSPTVGVQGFPLNSQWTLSYYSDKPPSAVGQIVEYRDSVAGGGSVPITGVPLPTATGETLGTYTRYSTTFTINASPVATSRCLVVHISSSDTASATFAYAQLEPGSVASSVEIRPIGIELSLCQRYYEAIDCQRFYENCRYSGDTGWTNSGFTTVQFAVPKRVNPARSLTDFVNRDNCKQLDFINSSTNMVVLQGIIVLPQYPYYIWSGTVRLDAEL